MPELLTGWDAFRERQSRQNLPNGRPLHIRGFILVADEDTGKREDHVTRGVEQ